MLFRARKTRKFSYTPSFYDEKSDQEYEARKRRIVFRSEKKYSRKKKSWIGVLILLVIAIFLILYLNKIRTQVPKDVELKNMEILK